MYSREEATRLRQEFWITFGKYMKPVLGANGSPVNWINYKTGVKHVFFKTDASNKQASVGIMLTHKDKLIRQIYFEQFESFKAILTDALGEDWHWQLRASGTDGPASWIGITITDVSIFDKSKWPAIISFLKPRLIALDEFWCDVKPVFESLG